MFFWWQEKNWFSMDMGKGFIEKIGYSFLVCGATIENIGWLAKISAYFNLKDKVKHGKTRI